MLKKSKYNMIIDEEDGRVLAFNTNNSALCWVTKDIYEKWLNVDYYLDNSMVPLDLIKLGFLVDSNIDELAQLEFEKKSFVFNKNPKQMGFVIAPTLTCNMHCKYCFENNMNRKGKMTIKDAQTVIEFIKTSLENNHSVQKLWIRWFGGEPTLALDIIKYIACELIAYCDENNIHYSSMIISNGLLLDDTVGKELLELRVIRAQITLDGFSETYSSVRNVEKDTFNKVLGNIRDLSMIMNVVIRINVTANNKDEVTELVLFLLEKCNLNNDNIWIYLESTRDFSFNDHSVIINRYEVEKIKGDIIDLLCEKGHIKNLLHYLPQRNIFSCSAMQFMTATIGPDCKLYRCDNCMDSEKWVIGSCSEGFYRNEAELTFVNQSYRDKCKKCNLLPMCGGGCNADYILEDNLPDCEAIKLRIINSVKLFAQYKKGGK